MGFKEMCLKSGMRKKAAQEYADVVDYANMTDKLLMLYYMWGMIDGGKAALELEQLERQRDENHMKKRRCDK